MNTMNSTSLETNTYNRVEVDLDLDNLVESIESIKLESDKKYVILYDKNKLDIDDIACRSIDILHHKNIKKIEINPNWLSKSTESKEGNFGDFKDSVVIYCGSDEPDNIKNLNIKYNEVVWFGKNKSKKLFQFLNIDQTVPEIFNYIEEWNLHKFNLVSSIELFLSLTMSVNIDSVLSKLINSDQDKFKLNMLISEGKYLKKSRLHMINLFPKKMAFATSENYLVLYVGTNIISIDVDHLLIEKYPYIDYIVYYYTEIHTEIGTKSEVELNLTTKPVGSNPEIDLSISDIIKETDGDLLMTSVTFGEMTLKSIKEKIPYVLFKHPIVNDNLIKILKNKFIDHILIVFQTQNNEINNYRIIVNETSTNPSENKILLGVLFNQHLSVDSPNEFSMIFNK